MIGNTQVRVDFLYYELLSARGALQDVYYKND